MPHGTELTKSRRARPSRTESATVTSRPACAAGASARTSSGSAKCRWIWMPWLEPGQLGMTASAVQARCPDRPPRASGFGVVSADHRAQGPHSDRPGPSGQTGKILDETGQETDVRPGRAKPRRPISLRMLGGLATRSAWSSSWPPSHGDHVKHDGLFVDRCPARNKRSFDSEPPLGRGSR